MEFKRINKDTVNCIITEDDMDEQGIKLEDLFEKKKEAMDFLHEVMRKAEEEVDYKPTGSFMPLQITVLPDHSISLTLSENASASFGEILRNLTEKAGLNIPKNILEDLGDTVDEERLNRLNEYLKSLKELTGSVKKALQESGIAESAEMPFSQDKKPGSEEKVRKISTPIPKNKEKAPSDREKDLKRLKFHEYVFSFADLKTVIAFCSKVSKKIGVESSLYKNPSDGHYYLDLMRKDEDPKVFAALFTMAYEFGHFQASNTNIIAHIKESYDCLIKGNAIEELSLISAR
jgi:adapter protein MecA 1/2